MDSILKIAVVEDHYKSLEQMLIFLRSLGFFAEGTDCGEGLNELLAQHQFNLVILDLNLPQEDGLSIASRLKETHPEIGVIILSARTLANDRLLGYQSGADVYLHKPVNLSEIEAVIFNLARRLNLVAKKPSVVLDMDRATLHIPDCPEVRLTQTEARLLRILAQMPAREADNDYLIFAVSKGEYATMTKENLQVHMSRVRAKVPALQDGSSIVSAIRGYGYRLNIPIELG